MVNEVDPPTNTSVRAVSIESLLTEMDSPTPFDFLKVDIEGAEATVFKDPGLLQMLPDIALVSIEVHDRFQASASRVVADAFAGLEFNQSQSGEYLVFTNAHAVPEPEPTSLPGASGLKWDRGGTASFGVAVLSLFVFASWLALSVAHKHRG